MVDMVGNRTGEFLCCFLVCFAQFGYFGSRFRVQFSLITHVYNRFGNTFSPDIISESLFAGSLQSRTIGTESDTVVFPGNIVHTFRIELTAGNCGESLGSARFNLISNTAVCVHINRENNFLVVCDLIRNLRSVIVGNDERFAIQFGNGIH